MRYNGEILKLLEKQWPNEFAYYDGVATPLLNNLLGIPKEPHIFLRSFPIDTFMGEQQTDYLIVVDGIPMMAVEAKPRAGQFDDAFRQVKFYVTNFDPKKSGVKRQSVPFVMVLAGSKGKCYKMTIRPDGITQDLVELQGYLEWSDLQKEAAAFKTKVEAQLGLLPPPTPVLADQKVLASQQWGQLFEGMYEILRKSRLFSHPDEIIECLNELLLISLKNPKKIESVMQTYGLRQREKEHLNAHLNWYKIQDVAGPTVAYAYREFVGRNFTGDSFGLKKVGRYLTPAEVIKFMVSLCGVKPTDKVIDFACGSGGFLGEVLGQVKNQTKNGMESFVEKNLFACDIDPFSVSTSKTFLSLLYPELSGAFHVYKHNALYSETPKLPKNREDGLPEAVKEGSFDLVISNPPGNKKYSGNNAAFVRKKYGLDKMFWDVVPFVRRAMQLAKPEGGRICLVVPDGFTANAQLKFLRDEVGKRCQLEAIVSLPRIFKNNNAQMSILYMTTGKKIKPEKNVLLATIPLKGISEDGKEETVNITAEFDYILEEFRKMER